MTLQRIKNFPKYLVSKTGTILSDHGTRRTKIKPQLYDGYLRARLTHPKTKKVHTMRIHRLVASAFVPGEQPGYVVDHINRKRQDNRACNLRWVSQSTNLMNTKMSSRNTSGVRGVHRSERGTWRAHASLNGKCINLGRFKTKKQAVFIRKLSQKFIDNDHF